MPSMDAVSRSHPGGGLARALEQLENLERNPNIIERARERYSKSPKMLSLLSASGTTTRSGTPVTPREEQRREEKRLKEERHYRLIAEQRASLPCFQFDAQLEKEKERIWDADPMTSGVRPLPLPGGSIDKEPYRIIKSRWVEQGIWNDEWNDVYRPIGLWKHEDPATLPAGEVRDMNTPKQSQQRKNGGEQQNPRPNQLNKRERDASRPYQQFFYQVSIEREMIQSKSSTTSGPGHDINSQAYNNIKNEWITQGIWNRKWGVLPGMTWKHEEPLDEEESDEDPIPAKDARDTANNETHGEASPSSHRPAPRRKPSLKQADTATGRPSRAATSKNVDNPNPKRSILRAPKPSKVSKPERKSKTKSPQPTAGLEKVRRSKRFLEEHTPKAKPAATTSTIPSKQKRSRKPGKQTTGNRVEKPKGPQKTEQPRTRPSRKSQRG